MSSPILLSGSKRSVPTVVVALSSAAIACVIWVVITFLKKALLDTNKFFWSGFASRLTGLLSIFGEWTRQVVVMSALLLACIGIQNKGHIPTQTRLSALGDRF
jgi:chromate transport protein ChrA